MISPKQAFMRDIGSIGLMRSQGIYTKEIIEKYINPKSAEVSEAYKYTKDEFFTGRIYTYQYNPLYKDKLDYYDTQPIILSIKHYTAESTKNDIEVGLNINFLPPEVRIGLLEVFWQTYRKQLNANDVREQQNKITFKNIRLDDYEFLKSVFNTVAGIGFQFAFRQYIRSRIKNARMIKYNDWYKLAFLVPTTITGKDVNEIYKIYHEETPQMIINGSQPKENN